MEGKMKGVTLYADWEPRSDFVLGAKDIEGRQTYLGKPSIIPGRRVIPSKWQHKRGTMWCWVADEPVVVEPPAHEGW